MNPQFNGMLKMRLVCLRIGRKHGLTQHDLSKCLLRCPKAVEFNASNGESQECRSLASSSSAGISYGSTES